MRATAVAVCLADGRFCCEQIAFGVLDPSDGRATLTDLVDGHAPVEEGDMTVSRTTWLVLSSSLVLGSCSRSEQPPSEDGASELDPSPRPSAERPASTSNVAPQPTSLGGPQSSSTVAAPVVSMGKALFSCGYSNGAWGRVVTGRVLDDQGRIWVYDSRVESSSQPMADSDPRFPGARLESRRVSLAELEFMRKKAEVVRRGRIEHKLRGFDAGQSGCRAYVWESPDKYHVVQLGETGDEEIKNTSPQAAVLMKWLRKDLEM